MADIQIVYLDVATKRIVRISDFTSLICPADLDDTYWKLTSPRAIPRPLHENPRLWELTLGREFKNHGVDVSEEDQNRFALLNEQADCLEQLSKMLNNIRFGKGTNMVGHQTLVPLYQAEIDNYRTTGVIGPLLRSLTDSDEDVPVAIAEWEIRNTTYIDFLVTNETIWNKWSRKIKKSTDPQSVLKVFKTSISMTA